MAIAPTTPPTIAPVCDVAPLVDVPEAPLDVLVDVLLSEPEPDAELSRILDGKTLAGAVGCVEIWPFPTINLVPLLGIPLIVTKRNAGPGWKMLGFGGTCAT